MGLRPAKHRLTNREFTQLTIDSPIVVQDQEVTQKGSFCSIEATREWQHQARGHDVRTSLAVRTGQGLASTAKWTKFLETVVNNFLEVTNNPWISSPRFIAGFC